jgi:DNA-binding response OmpR family regulator
MNILVVDDEPQILQLLESYLRRNGHSVQTAANGMSTLALLDSGSLSAGIQVAVIDFSLPDVSGAEVGLEILKRTAATVVFASGYAIEPNLMPEAFQPRVRVLRKPFMPKAILDVLEILPGVTR